MIRQGFSAQAVNRQTGYFNLPREIPADSAWNLFKKQGPEVERLQKINFGPVNGYFWLRLNLRNHTRDPLRLYVQIRQPHLYHIQFYEIHNNTAQLISNTGIKYDFNTRPKPERYFNFPVAVTAGGTADIMLMIHHINSLTLPLYVVTEQSLHDTNYRQNLAWGFWLGFLSFCALFALIASMLVRKMVFLWYFFYMTSAALYGFTELGFGFQYLFPEKAGLDAPAIIHLGIYSLFFLIKFSQALLETRRHLPFVHAALNVVFFLLLAAIVAGYTITEIMFRFSFFILPALNLIVMAGLLLLAFAGIRSFFINRTIAIFYLIAYLTLVSAGIFATLNYGFGVYQYTGPNPILVAYFFEAMLLSVALVILFRQLQSEKTALTRQVAETQKQLYQQYIAGIEKERGRIAGELHDDIGSRLSHLQRLITTKDKMTEASHHLSGIIQDVRRLSHALAPPMAHITGLVPLVEKIVAETRSLTEVDIKLQVHNFVTPLKEEQVQQLYRIIQEAVSNIVHHAKATQADIQLFEYPNELVLTIDDNGAGFDPQGVKDGLGLAQMTVRTESIGGSIDIQSRPGTGCHIMIHVPI